MNKSTNLIKVKNLLRIKSKNTKPEIKLRSALFAKGYRFKIHSTKLPGRPDIVLPKYNMIINVHGCFWHRHGCPNSSIPKTRQSYWLNILEQTNQRDFKNKNKLQKLGWRVLDVWECSLKNKNFNKAISLVERMILAA